MRQRTTEEKNNFRLACIVLASAAMVLWVVSRFVAGTEARQLLTDLSVSMTLGLIICSGFFLAKPGLFKSKWNQPQ